jgi:hypothetical protein
VASESTAICDLIHLTAQRTLAHEPGDEWLFVRAPGAIADDEPTRIEAPPTAPMAEALATQPDAFALPPAASCVSFGLPYYDGTPPPPTYAVAPRAWLPARFEQVARAARQDPARYALPAVLAASLVVLIASGAFGVSSPAGRIGASLAPATQVAPTISAPTQQALALPSSLID